MIKIKSLAPHTKNISVILPIVGLKTFDENNCIEVEDSQAEDLLACDIGYELVENEVSETEEEEIVRVLSKLTISQLKEKIAEFPAEETSELKSKSSIIDFLKSKMGIK